MGVSGRAGIRSFPFENYFLKDIEFKGKTIYNRNMNKLIMKIIRMSDRQVAFLSKISDERGISFTEIVRRIIDEYIDKTKKDLRTEG